MKETIILIYLIGFFVSMMVSASYYKYHMHFNTGKVKEDEGPYYWLAPPVAWPAFVFYYIMTFPGWIAIKYQGLEY